MSGAPGVQVPLLFGPDSNTKHALNKKAPPNKRNKEVRARKPEKGRSYHTDALTPRHGIHTRAFTHQSQPVQVCTCVCVCTRLPLDVLRVMIKAQQTSRTPPAALLQKYTRLSRLAPHSSHEECRKHVPLDEYPAHVTEGRTRSNAVATPRGTRSGGGISRKTLVAHAQEKRLQEFQRGRANTLEMSNLGRPMYAT